MTVVLLVLPMMLDSTADTFIGEDAEDDHRSHCESHVSIGEDAEDDHRSHCESHVSMATMVIMGCQ